MKKRKLAGLILGIICFSFFLAAFTQPVLAQEIKVNLRIEGPVDTIVDVSDYPVETGIAQSTIPAADVFKQVLTDSNIKYKVYDEYCYFTSIGKYSETKIGDYYIGWSYGINGQPMDNTKENVQVRNGDSLVLYYGDMRKAFPSYYLQLRKDGSVSIKFTYTGDNGDMVGVKNQPLANARVCWDDKEFITNDNGVVVIPREYAIGGVHSLNVERFIPGVTLATGEPCPNVLRLPLGNTVEYINFGDLDNHQWAKNYIYNLVYLNVINGTSPDCFQPAGNLTRAQFVKMLCAMKGVDVAKYSGYTNFSDVPQNKWYTPYVNWAKENMVTNGIDKDRFGPDESITRQDFVTMLYRFSLQEDITLKTGELDVDFSDAGEIRNYALDSVNALLEAGIINGYKENGNTLFKPFNFTTRAEAAKMLSVYYDDYMVH